MPTCSLSSKRRPSSARLSLRSGSVQRYSPSLFHNPISRDRSKKFSGWGIPSNAGNARVPGRSKRRPRSAFGNRNISKFTASKSTLVPKRPKSAGTFHRRRFVGKNLTHDKGSNSRLVQNQKVHQTDFTLHAIREAAAREKCAKHIQHTLTFHEPQVEVRPNHSGNGGIRKGQYFFLAAYQSRLRGEYLAAVRHYTSALAHYKQDTKALLNRGYCLCRVGKIGRAIEDFKRAAKLSPASPFAWYNLGIAHQKLYNTNSSIEAFTKAIECLKKLPNDFDHSKEEIQERNRFIKANIPLLASIILSRAMSYRLENRFFEASQDYTRLEKLKQQHGLRNFGNILNLKGSGNSELISNSLLYQIENVMAEQEQKSISLDQVKEEGSIAHLSKYFQEALLCLQKPSSERDNKDLKVLADLTSNVPAFKKLSKDNHRKLCSKMICVNLDDGDVLFDQGEEGFFFYVIVVGKISLHMQSTHHRISSEREHDAPSKHKAGSNMKTGDLGYSPEIDANEERLVTDNRSYGTTWESLWRSALIGKKKVKKFTRLDDQKMVYVTTLHIGDSFGELALTENAPRRATCVSSGKSILLTVGKDEFDGILKQQRADEIDKTWRFLKNVDLLRSISDAELKSLAGIVEREHHNCDSVILAEGNEYHHLRIVRSGKCRVVKNLAIRDNHAIQYQDELTHGESSPITKKLQRKRLQRRRTIENLALISSRASQGNRFSVSREDDVTWETRRAAAVKDHLKLAKAKKNWDSSRHDAYHPDSAEAIEANSIHQHKEKTKSRKLPVELCSLFPGDTIGEENILGIEDPETGNMKHHKRKANASVVADTQVEILIIRKVDLFRRTNYSIRGKMRANLKAKEGNSNTSVLEDPMQQIRKKKAWEKYRSDLMKEAHESHLAKAVIYGR